jgi:hypothetical protein
MAACVGGTIPDSDERVDRMTLAPTDSTLWDGTATGLVPASSASLSPSSAVTDCRDNRATDANLSPTCSFPACAGAGSYAAAVLADSPLAFWELQDASGNPADSSGNALDMTAHTGSPQYQQAGPIADYSITFPGSGGVSRSTISAATNNVALELFLLPVLATSTSQTLFYNGNGGANGWGLLTNYAANNFRIVGLLGGKGFLTQFPSALTSGQWYHVVMTRDAGTWKYYLNGALVNANAGTTAPNSPE